MSRPTSVRLDEHFQTFIATLLREGRYRSADQVVHAGRALLEHQTKLEALRTALGKGERSGFIENFDFDAFIEEKLQGEGVEAIEPRPPPHR
ncbi:type II toxin-antitoxin system ParD family antitoxin [Caulobacter sp. UNC279MFTsu5.1]|uniref:type II toxin-antitoxin system ParD family antitoxin n=1 Tax=Caulobacter sp. UNC279MFTsu5.1 TaxID=1502775 RepID=UPI0006742F9A|nr:type II toxin-antitoxin system ParD family antitoxin [Caulobacter sp. UNC279MFTsu5.1]SFI82742.1 antitoxin ParD1/3/4 [Caulobacter sp. UNC279MFTsu5.1]